MLNLDTIQRIYFIGIGGIGMSAIARYFAFRGKAVSGYDRTETNLTKQLISEGIQVMYTDDASLAPVDADLVVYTPAVPHDHSQLSYYRSHGYTLMKRSELLGAITEQSYNICVAGTHGKTTISTMIAHILRHSGYGCNAFLGGISVNYNTNFWSSERNLCVVEADEYDRSFLRLSPDVAVITATDADHLDIYGDEESLRTAFVDFAGKLKPGGTLLAKKGLAIGARLKAPRILLYSIEDIRADILTSNIRLRDGYYSFDLRIAENTIRELVLNMGGKHNVENASVAIAVARLLDIDVARIKEAVAEFKGVKRRFEYIIKSKDIVYIDDYAHHPAELASLISSARELYPELLCVVVFQPHLFTRTQDLDAGFAESLDLADEVLLLPIYPARELPIPGVTSALIREKMKNGNVKEVEKDTITEEINRIYEMQERLLLITAGAGDIDAVVEPIKKQLTLSKNEHQ
jgi:UDP-N-acetylmuramate--alanine ligase